MKMNTKFCGKCGASNPAEMAFCSQCGAHFENREPVNNFNQPSSTFSPDLSPAPNYAPQMPFQAPQANSFPENKHNLQPPNSSGANNFSAPNQAFQPPQFQPESQSPAYYKADPKPGIGSKIWSALGVLAVGAFLFLKFGFVLLRAGRLGGIGMIAVVFLIVVAWGVYGFIRKT
jgi:hypothetical protein